jgi:signal transduction histidine kinase
MRKRSRLTGEVGQPEADDDPIERVRLHLRSGASGAAVAILRQYTGPVDDHYHAVRAYAYELRRAQSGVRERTEPADLRRLDAAALQRVLRWLTREELRAGEKALAEGRFAAAVDLFRAADRIDDRGVDAALLQATALYEFVSSALSRQQPLDLDRARRHLTAAARLTQRATADAALAVRGEHLAAEIDTLLRRVDQGRERQRRVQEVDNVVRRFKALVAHSERNPPRVMMERTNLRTSLAPIGGEVTRLRRRHPADSPEGRLLAEVAGEIEVIQAQFR